MTELERLELAKAKAVIEFYGWSASDLGLTTDPKPLGDVFDGGVFKTILADNKPFRGKYLTILQGDGNLQAVGFKGADPIVKILTDYPTTRSDVFELKKIN